MITPADREALHQCAIVARQEARLRFFRKRAMAAFRALDNACSSDPGYVGGSAIALAVSAQRKRNWYLGII